MTETCLIAIDCGTDAVRALTLSPRGRILGEARRSLAMLRTAPGRAEQDAPAMRLALLAVVDEALQASSCRPIRLGIAVQRSSVVCWDRETGEPLSPVMSWQDVRAADRLMPLRGRETEIFARTGLRLSPHYGASKMSWALDHLPAVSDALSSGRLAMGPLASWLLQLLRPDGEPEVDEVNASRTLLWHLEQRHWDPWLLGLFSLPSAALPRGRPIRHEYGQIADRGLPITALSGDQNAALFADGPLPTDRALINLGTGAFVLQATGASPRRVPGLLCGLADSDTQGVTYLSEGTVNGAGAALRWAEDRWDLTSLAQRLDAYLNRGVEPALFLNAVGGLGSPWWRHGMESRLVDQKRYLKGHRPADFATETAIVQGVAESILFLIRRNLDAMLANGPECRALRVSGGLARSDQLCDRLAALVGLPVERCAESEATARGIAWLAAGCPEDWRRARLEKFPVREDSDLQMRYEIWLNEMKKFA